ncbi:MAG: GspE/PulE family protein [Phycisphaerae bacterium]|nr:GspE/PulE family protein [Phycisphaerae bacterium]
MSSVQGLTDLYSPEQEMATCETRDVADILLEQQKIDQAQYVMLRKHQQANPGSDSAQWLMSEQHVSELTLLEARAMLHGFEFQRLHPSDVNRTAFDLIDQELQDKNGMVAVRLEGDVVVVATYEPANVFAVEDVRRHLERELRVLVCPEEDLKAICDAMSQTDQHCDLADIMNDLTEVEVVQEKDQATEDIERMAGESPVIKYVNYLISNAIREGASDIHIEPKEKITRIRYRIDGVLFDVQQAPVHMHSALVSRVKIMSNLDISERRLPQDGKVSVIVGGRGVDLRISTLPTNHGEKTVIRVLDSRSILLDFDKLGMSTAVSQALAEQTGLPHGVFLVTGPTGSGKSTTLYSALRQMDGNRMNISTVEDPVEYELDFCSQVQISDKIGLTFASALRSLLRQDPDIIMIGEIRDNETAGIAVQAALTGHLVLSTLHTNDAASSVTRLVNIGIDPYLIAASLNAVLAQRLVRRICSHCKEPFLVPDHMFQSLERFGIIREELFHGAGCEMCHGSGFSGRVGIYEMLTMNDHFRDIINEDACVANMQRAFRESGARSLFDDGIRKVRLGETTMEEVLRVTEVGDLNSQVT